MDNVESQEAKPPATTSQESGWGFSWSPIFVGAIASGMFVWFFSISWGCSAVGAAVVTAIILALVMGVVRICAGRSWPVSPRWQLASTLLVAWGVSLFFRVSASELFERALGMPPPEGVRGLVAEWHYAGGPGDQTVLLRFNANRATIERIIEHRGFVRDTEITELFWTEQRDPAVLWGCLFSHAQSHIATSWKTVPSMTAPEVYRWRDTREYGQDAKLLWDAESGETYVEWIFG